MTGVEENPKKTRSGINRRRRRGKRRRRRRRREEKEGSTEPAMATEVLRLQVCPILVVQISTLEQQRLELEVVGVGVGDWVGETVGVTDVIPQPDVLHVPP